MLKRITLVVVICTSLQAHAALDEKHQQLNELRQRIEQLKREVEQASNERNEAADALRTSERNISELNRGLHDLGVQEGGLNRDLSRLTHETHLTEARLEEQRNRLALLLRQRYYQGSADATRLALSGENPATVARQLGYAAAIAHARTELIHAHDRTLQRLTELRIQVSSHKQQLSKLRNEQLERKKDLEKEKKSRVQVIGKISEQIRKQRKEIGTLERDEQRLTRLIERLARMQAAATAARAKNKAKPGQKIDRVADESLAGIEFARLRGKLALPTVGEIVARFGQAREGGGPTWKGLFIRTSSGRPVLAVGTGRVVFADWLRGFGNLIILDHGNSYLSLYSNNESLYKQAGDAVRAGDAIAAVGNTGGHEHTGLYFELRHDGKPFDPLSWTTRK